MYPSQYNHRCDTTVKQKSQSCHRKCDTSKLPRFVSGTDLNSFFNEEKSFDEDGCFRICDGMKTLIEKKHATKPQQGWSKRGKVCEKTPEGVYKYTKKWKSPHLHWSPLKLGTSKRLSFIHSDDNTPVESVVYDHYLRQEHHDKFCGDVLDIAKNKYRKSYKDLVLLECRCRTDNLTKEVVAACVDCAILGKEGKSYLKINYDLAVDVITLLDSIHERVQCELDVNMMLCEKRVTPPPDCVMNENDELKKLDIKMGGNACTLAMLTESKRSGYDRLRLSILQEFHLPQNSLPSYYILTKSRPNVLPIELSPTNIVNNNQQSVTDSELLILGDDNSVDIPNSCLVKEKAKDFDQAVRNLDNNVKYIMGARLEGTYATYCSIMMKKHDACHRDLGEGGNWL